MTTTSAPRASASSAAAAPMPVAPPTTRTRWPSNRSASKRDICGSPGFGWSGILAPLPEGSTTGKTQSETEQPMKEPGRQQASAYQQQAGIETHRVPGERRARVEGAGERPSEAFGRPGHAQHESF